MPSASNLGFIDTESSQITRLQVVFIILHTYIHVLYLVSSLRNLYIT
jgi:hypothetical protein